VWLVNVERAFGQTAEKMQEEEERRQALWDAGYYEKD
jgi:hypothetical protein